MKKYFFAAVAVVFAGGLYWALTAGDRDHKPKGKDPETSETTTSGSSEAPVGPGARGSASATPGVTAAPSETAGGGAGATAPSGSAPVITSGQPVNMEQLLLEAKYVENARSALAAGDPKRALRELDFYDKIPNATSLRQEATLIKIEALSQSGRKAEARALAYSTRDDPSFNSYQDRIEGILNK